MTKTEHQRYVQSVRYSPNGDHFATGGFDGKIFIYDGKTSDLIGELGKNRVSLLTIEIFHRHNCVLRKPCSQWWSLRCVLER